jgi:hypothetical protein
MTRSRFTKLGGALTALLAGLLFAGLAMAADTATTTKATGFGPFYDAKHEITLTGTIQEVVDKHTAGAPAGMHLLVAASQGVVDAHLGPFMNKDTKEALHTGTPVQIVGAMVTLHGKEYLYARQLIFGGRTVTVRSEHGSLTVVQPRTQGVRTQKSSTSVANGGAR